MKSQQQIWNECYASPQGWYPNEFVVRFAAKYLRRRTGVDAWQVIDPAVARVLDLGCGAGRHVAFFAESGCNTAGIDLSDTAVEAARHRIRKSGLAADLRAGSATSLPWPDSSFDAVVSCGVLDHMPPADCTATVNEVFRVLRPGGLFYLDLVAKEEYSFGQGRMVAPDTFEIQEGLEKGLVQRFFDPASIAALLDGRFAILDSVRVTIDPLQGQGLCSLEIRSRCTLARHHCATRKQTQNDPTPLNPERTAA
jgi:ubiquinone/menaquinone biosynthesis C-methylase UbiE